jgi:hypothetical protein
MISLHINFYCCDGVRLCLCGTVPLTDPLSISQMIQEWIWSSGGMILTGENRRTWRKSCPSATLSTTNRTWTDLGENSVLHSKKPETNRLSYGTVLQQIQNFTCFPEMIHYSSPSNRKLNTDFTKPTRCCFTVYKKITATKIAYFSKIYYHSNISRPYSGILVVVQYRAHFRKLHR